MTIEVAQLLGMAQAELDRLFGDSPAGDVPDGEAKGTAIVAPGTRFTREIAELINLFAWQGKVFDKASGTLRNHILPFGMKAIIAEVAKGPSWQDGKECVVLDYARTSLVAQRIRDEIRPIGPGRYLGIAYWGKMRVLNFALQF